jgi:NAD(P)-dependent dehydrogenase (short-subunit alcohol dehydrogenase family)
VSISYLSGRGILVTGASSGIGEATCRALVGCGASVAMLARRNDRLSALSAELGERAIGIQCDVTDLDTLGATVARAVDTLGGLDAVITVAGFVPFDLPPRCGARVSQGLGRWRDTVGVADAEQDWEFYLLRRAPGPVDHDGRGDPRRYLVSERRPCRL